ncbi:MAG: MarR family transcriptional regulator [Anaeroplasma sp.]|nr:MarR family transcriptional regulator [Anaeroplasma sp.]
MQKLLCRKINKVSTKVKREITNLKKLHDIDELSGENGRVLGFIYHNKEKIYQKDIEKEFGITRSTASNTISLLEKKGFLKRNNSEEDQRLKSLVLTEKGINHVKIVSYELSKFDKEIEDNFTDDELNQFISYLEKLEKILDERKKNND